MFANDPAAAIAVLNADLDELLACDSTLIPTTDGGAPVYTRTRLLELGDVRGELIVAQLEGKEARAKALLKNHGAAGSGTRRDHVQFDFERGFPSRLAIDCTRSRQLKRVCDGLRVGGPSARSTLGGPQPDLGSETTSPPFQKAAVQALAKSPGSRARVRPSLEDIARSEASMSCSAALDRR